MRHVDDPSTLNADPQRLGACAGGRWQAMNVACLLRAWLGPVFLRRLKTW